jgi:epoxyqueuosine reductase
MNRDSLTAQLNEHALSLGVDLIGITSAKAFIKEDGKGTVIDPKDMLAGARAVIVTAFYMNEEVHAPPVDRENPRGRFTHAYSLAAYTPMENHYIGLIRQFLKKHGYRTAANRKYTIPDKMAAARAGIGKYGKNSIIMTKAFGSYVMFVTMVTDAPLEYEENDIHASECGRCVACIEACPTGAIYESYRVKRDLCITDWLWGKRIPVHLREKQENRIFGCGECVKACPRNKKLVPRKEYPVKLRDFETAPGLIALVTGGKEHYRRTMAPFPLRAGIDSIRGNAIIALGNIGADKAVDPLCVTLRHLKPQIRAYSAWALGKIGGAKAGKALGYALKHEMNRKVASEIQHAVQRSGASCPLH